MGEDTKIQWCHHTFNPWRGCTKVHTGCANCYAEQLSGRNPKTLGTWGPNGTRVVAAESCWREPLKWNRAAEKAGERRRVFCASLADVFEAWEGPVMHHLGGRMINCPNCGWEPFMGNDGGDGCENKWLSLDDVRRRLFGLPRQTPWLDWLVLTKRPELVVAIIDRTVGLQWWKENCPNVWIGTSVSDQPTADEYAKRFRDCRDLSPVLFLSVEPLVGPIERLPLEGIDWVIVGGESDPKARYYCTDWAESIIGQCRDAGVPVFHKQVGAMPFTLKKPDAWPDGTKADKDYHREYGDSWRLMLNDPKGGDPTEWPERLRVREFPNTATNI